MKITVLFSIVLFFMVIAANAQGVGIGLSVDGFSLSDIGGRVEALDALKGRNGTVLIFLSAQCPVVKVYKDRINDLAAVARTKGINFIGINSNSNESLDVIRADAGEKGYRFPVLVDKGNTIADKLGARATPEVFYIDADNVLLYRGAIDNDRSGTTVTTNYLLAAFEASLAGRPIIKKSMAARGCSIRNSGP
jgi:peroxiredoxin